MTLFEQGYKEAKAILGFKNKRLLIEGVRRLRRKMFKLPEGYSHGCIKAASERN